MLAILGQVPEDPAAVAAFARASRTLVDWWDAHADSGADAIGISIRKPASPNVYSSS